jgi:cytochrome c oxidase cbb3-type subunit 3
MTDHDQENTEIHQEELPKGVTLKPHSHDGIHEYDQRLPRWWLLTLFGAVLFSAIYWLMLDIKSFKGEIHQEIETRMAAIETLRLANSIDVTDNARFWEMANSKSIVKSGEATFQTNCVACHSADLTGGIGFNLVDAEWVHGAAPASIYQTVFNGVPEKGMQAWGSLLGQKKIAEVIAYVLSKNDRAIMEAAPNQ